MFSVYFNEMPSVFILPAYIKLLKQQKALKNQPFFKAFSRSFFTANSMYKNYNKDIFAIFQ